MGRPSKLTPDRVARIEEALRAGAPISVAASRGTIAPSTYHEWEARGRAQLELASFDVARVPDDERPYAEFSETVTRARHDWELGRLAQIQRAGQGQAYTVTTTKTEERLVDGAVVAFTTTTVKEGVEYDWRADAWLLERRNPSVYGRVFRAEVTGPEGAPIEVTVEALVARGEAAVEAMAERQLRLAASDGVAVPELPETGTGPT